MKVSLITPTGDRQEMFSLCEWLIKRQTYNGELEWIVVDDGIIPTNVSCGQKYIRRSSNTKKITKDTHTVGDNLREGLNHVNGDIVLIIEDDDYYSPFYIEKMAGMLEHYDCVGESGSKYYDLRNNSYEFFKDLRFTSMAALSRTGFRKSLIKRMLRSCDGDCQVDKRFWNLSDKTGLLKPSVSGLHVSIKGGKGRQSHNYDRRLSGSDYGYTKLLEWMNGDLDALNKYKSLDVDNIIVYTCLTFDRFGKPYSNLRPFGFGGAAICFCNPEINCYNWTKNYINPGFDNQTLSRYWKILSHKMFPEYKYTLYIDSSMSLLIHPLDYLRGDVIAVDHPNSNNVGMEIEEVKNRRLAPQKTISYYDKYQDYFSEVAYQCGFLLRKNTEKVNLMNEIWWDIVKNSGSRRDQIAFPIASKISGVEISSIPWSDRARKYTKWTGHKNEREIY